MTTALSAATRASKAGRIFWRTMERKDSPQVTFVAIPCTRSAVGIVADVAHQLLDHVFQRHDPSRTTRTGGDHGHVPPPPLPSQHRTAEGRQAGNQIGSAQSRGEVGQSVEYSWVAVEIKNK